MKNEINLMKTSISQCYVDSSHQISCYVDNFLRTCYMKNEINLMKTSISQCYVDSSHQISCYELLVWKMK